MSEVLHDSAAVDAAEAAVQSKKQPETSEPASVEEEEQRKHHQQMLYPTPGLRNYGFSDAFMIHTFKVSLTTSVMCTSTK